MPGAERADDVGGGGAEGEVVYVEAPMAVGKPQGQSVRVAKQQRPFLA